jgi:hypothetical protein
MMSEEEMVAKVLGQIQEEARINITNAIKQGVWE